MTEQEKKARTRRPKSEVVADLKKRIARHEWAGPLKALEIVKACAATLEEAAAAAGLQVNEIGERWTAAQEILGEIQDRLDKAIPPEARS